MTQREQELREGVEIAEMKRELDDILTLIGRGSKRTFERRMKAYSALGARLAVKAASMAESVPDVKPAILPEPEPKVGVQ